ncbi:hypothetical protein KGF54_001921 [Candida jiufengensis]|uniref:uncharacterized protein n=1 Tax=Candida jiufengensis TaxID=497108 RepID=UPI00222598EF|nr:uncharacterized protein KGF54_001921 [Candida jiufengensis]KAI5955360.1 hypothetical protein KGF54_001921 [Candida jiufengensis]
MATTFDIAGGFSQFPSVPKTASINGFADRIYDQLPECAQSCMHESTGSTPCPYWDTGCLCVMPQFAGAIANCVAEKCKGQDVINVEILATSICSSAGVWEPYWMIPASASSALDAAATVQAETTPTSTAEVSSETTSADQTTPSTTQAPETTASSIAQETSSAANEESTSVAQESSAAESSETQTSSSSEVSTGEHHESSAHSSVAASSTVNAESSSISVQVANAGNIRGVAVGGVIAAIAALI